jgi:hypothetical protein
MAEFRAPANDGEVLAVPDFAAVPALVEANRRKLDRDDVTIGGMPLRELRALARREVLELANGHASAGRADRDAPLLLTGHQPELAHPGVWVKNFALCGLAKKLGGVGLNLVVDNDTLKSTSLRFPVLPPRGPNVHLESLAFDRLDGEVPYEDREVLDAELFRTFPDRAAPLWARWGFEPLLPKVWREGRNIGDTFTAMRRERERAWGCNNLELTRLGNTTAFMKFAVGLCGDAPRFAEVYNHAILEYRKANHIRSEHHPAPLLRRKQQGGRWLVECPFWYFPTPTQREPVWVWEEGSLRMEDELIRPRALTLTLFARVCLGDFFIHGIGGGKYDEVTDAIIRRYFGIEPPAYQVLSATLHLPLPGFPSTPDDLKRAEHRVRDLHWNPQRHLSPENRDRPEVQALLERKAALAGAEPPRTDHAARKEWFRRLKRATEELRPFVFKQEPAAKAELARVRAEVAANEVLRRRDYAWVLYPEETLRPFLQRFLDV